MRYPYYNMALGIGPFEYIICRASKDVEVHPTIQSESEVHDMYAQKFPTVIIFVYQDTFLWWIVVWPMENG